MNFSVRAGIAKRAQTEATTCGVRSAISAPAVSVAAAFPRIGDEGAPNASGSILIGRKLFRGIETCGACHPISKGHMRRCAAGRSRRLGHKEAHRKRCGGLLFGRTGDVQGGEIEIACLST